MIKKIHIQYQKIVVFDTSVQSRRHEKRQDIIFFSKKAFGSIPLLAFCTTESVC